MQKRRQLVFFYLRPTLYDALAERAERTGADLNTEIIGVLERDVLPRQLAKRRRLPALLHMQPQHPTTSAG